MLRTTGLLACLASWMLVATSTAAAEPVDFNRDVKPILAAKCFKCHGPDKQESGLRLDAAAGLLSGGNSGPAVTPGKSGDSLLAKAIRGNDEAVSKMPPEDEGDPLGADDRCLVHTGGATTSTRAAYRARS